MKRAILIIIPMIVVFSFSGWMKIEAKEGISEDDQLILSKMHSENEAIIGGSNVEGSGDTNVIENELEDTRENIEKYFHWVADIFESYEAAILKSTEDFVNAETDDKKKDIMLKLNKEAEIVMNRIIEEPTPKSCQYYKELMIENVEEMIRLNELTLRVINEPETFSEEEKQSMLTGMMTDTRPQVVDKLTEEYNRIIKEFNIPDQEW